MTRVEINAERGGVVQSSSSSITLLQERFRQLRKAKEMREEKKISRMLSVKPNINTAANKFHHHQFKSSSSSAATAARNTAVSRGLLTFDLPDDYQLINSTSQSRSASNSSSSPTRPLRLGQRSRYGHEDQEEGNVSSLLYGHNNKNNSKKEKMNSLQYYCDIGKFLKPSAAVAENKVVTMRQSLHDGSMEKEEVEEKKRFDGVRSYNHHHDDIDTSLHL